MQAIIFRERGRVRTVDQYYCQIQIVTNLLSLIIHFYELANLLMPSADLKWALERRLIKRDLNEYLFKSQVYESLI
jgi:hypothetical protein